MAQFDLELAHCVAVLAHLDRLALAVLAHLALAVLAHPTVSPLFAEPPSLYTTCLRPYVAVCCKKRPLAYTSFCKNAAGAGAVAGARPESPVPILPTFGLHIKLLHMCAFGPTYQIAAKEAFGVHAICKNAAGAWAWGGLPPPQPPRAACKTARLRRASQSEHGLPLA